MPVYIFGSGIIHPVDTGIISPLISGISAIS